MHVDKPQIFINNIGVCMEELLVGLHHIVFQAQIPVSSQGSIMFLLSGAWELGLGRVPNLIQNAKCQ